jgi:hypothetical protein
LRQLGEVGGDIKVCSAPRWTPPMPPVAKSGMPAAAAAIIVAATVVPPVARGQAGRRGRGARLLPRRRRGEAVQLVAGQPDPDVPPISAIVAGTAPSARMTLSTCSRRFRVGRKRHAVGDDGGFQRHDGPA